MMSYRISCADESEMISYVWCMIIHMISSLIQPDSNAAPPRRACSNATRFESNAGPARPLCLSVSGCPGIKIRLQMFITLYQVSRRVHSHSPLPLSPPSSSISSARSSGLGGCLSDFGARLYHWHSTSLRLMYPDYSVSSTFFFKTPTMTSECVSARPSERILAAPPMYRDWNNNQAGKVGYQVAGNLCNSTECRNLRPPQESRRKRNWPGPPSRQSSSIVATYSSRY